MPLAQDQFRQKISKNYGTELHLQLDKSKKLCADPKDIWQIKLTSEYEKSVCGNDSEVGVEKSGKCKKSHFKCNEERQHFGEPKIGFRKSCQQKNVRFEPGDYSSIDDTSPDNESSDLDFTDNGSCMQHDHGKKRCCSMLSGSGQNKRSFDKDDRCEKLSDEQHCCHVLELTECRDCYAKCKSKSRGLDYCEARTKSSSQDNSRRKEEFEHRGRKSSPKGKFTYVKNCCDNQCEQRCNGYRDYPLPRVRSPHSIECEEKMYRCGDWCDRYSGEEPRGICGKRSQKSLHVLRHPKPYKHTHHMKNEKSDGEWKQSMDLEDSPMVKAHVYQTTVHQKPKLEAECCCHSKDICDHVYGGKQKKKVLDSYEELPVVSESQEHLSETTYKVSFSKCSNLNPAESLTKFPMEKVEDKTSNILDKSPSSIMYGDKLLGTTLNRSRPYDMHPERIVKMRSRRTKMNRRRNKWIKTYVHRVVSKTRNEVVGLMVLGERGPEFFSKSAEKPTFPIPFRKSRSFPEGPTKSYDMSLCFDAKDNFLASSDPGGKLQFSTKELLPAESDNKESVQTTDLSKNVNEVFKSVEEKFLKTLNKSGFEGATMPQSPAKETERKVEDSAKNETKAQMDNAEDIKKAKYPSFYGKPFEPLSSRIPKSTRKSEKSNPDVISYNVESKTIAENLNDQAKQFKMSQKEETTSKLSELVRKFPPQSLDKETMEANLSMWGMKIENSRESETPNARGGEGDGQNSQRESNAQRLTKRSTDSGNHIQCKLHPKKPAEEAQGGAEDASERQKDGKREESEKETEKLLEFLSSKWSDKREDESNSPRSDNKTKEETEQMFCDLFRDLVKNGCAISEKESENLQKVYRELRYEADMMGSVSSEERSKEKEEYSQKFEEEMNRRSRSREQGDCSRRSGSSPRKYKNSLDESEKWGKDNRRTSEDGDTRGDGYLSDVTSQKCSKGKEDSVELKIWKKIQNKQKDSKGKKRNSTLEKMKLLREALPSMAAENEAAHLEQLKEYLYQFIDTAKHKASSSTEARSRRSIKPKGRPSSSSDNSEVRVDARKIIDLVSDPFKRITSDMTITMAKKLTDALVQETTSKSAKNLPQPGKTRKNREDGTEEEASLPCATSSGSDRAEPVEPTYLKHLKEMRNDHLSNIITEVVRLNELLRYLDKMQPS